MHLRGDHLVDDTADHWAIEHPSGSDFLAALTRLDAASYTEVTITTAGDAHLAIAGGAGHYVVHATYGDSERWTLVRRQPGTAGADPVVTLDQARTAGLTYLLTGTLDPTLRWEKGDRI